MQLMFIPRLDALKYAALYGPLRALKLARVAWAVTERDTATCSRNCISNGFKRSTIKHDGASGRVHIDVLHTHLFIHPGSFTLQNRFLESTQLQLLHQFPKRKPLGSQPHLRESEGNAKPGSCCVRMRIRVHMLD